MNSSTREPRGQNFDAKKGSSLIKNTLQRSKLVSGLTLATGLAVSSLAQAQPVPFGPDVNRNPDVGGMQINPRPFPNEAKLTFDGGRDPVTGERLPLFEKIIQIEDDINGGIVVRGYGTARPILSGEMGVSIVEIDRGDGKTTHIVQSPESWSDDFQQPDLVANGEVRWRVENNSPCNHVSSIHRDPLNSRGLLIVTTFDNVLSPALGNVWRYPNIERYINW